MKKFLSVLTVIAMLFCLASTSLAAGADLEFSAKAGEGKPDDTVTYEVYIDKNAGTWGACVDVYYNKSVMTALSLTNGEIYTDKQYTSNVSRETENGEGCIRYFAELDSPSDLVNKTGLLFSISFQIKKDVPNGDYPVRLDFPDNGDGWFFQVDGDDFIDLTVKCTQQASVTVTGSSYTGTLPAETDNVTDKDDSPSNEPTADDTTKAPVTAYETDSEGTLVTDGNGDYVTYEVTDPDVKVPSYVFDSNGEAVTDEDGNYETYYTEEADPSGSDNTDNATEGDGKTDTDLQTKVNGRLLILIASILAVVVAAVIIVIVAINSKKEKNIDPDGSDNDGETDI